MKHLEITVYTLWNLLFKLLLVSLLVFLCCAATEQIRYFVMRYCDVLSVSDFVPFSSVVLFKKSSFLL